MLTANDAAALGMNVTAYTRSFSDDKRKNLSPGIKTVKTIEELLPDSDFLSINIAVNSQTEGLFNEDMFAKMKPGVKILNFARNELVNTDDLLAAIQSGIVSSYVTDFLSVALIDIENVIAIPHLGVSVAEAEENCAGHGLGPNRRLPQKREYSQFGKLSCLFFGTQWRKQSCCYF